MITEAMLSKIENDLHAGPTFVNLFKPFFCEEQPMFLLAVVKYKKNPTWDSLLSVYQKHISTKSKLEANIPAPARSGIENYVKFWGDNQKAFKQQGVNLHIGAVAADVFDAAFEKVMLMFDSQLDTNMQQRAVCEKFLADYHVS